MLNPPFRSPRKKVGGLYHFGRMIDKIRLHLREELAEEYRPNFGLSAGLDGHLCGFLGVSHSDLIQQVRLGKTDDEIAEWCFSNGSAAQLDSAKDLERLRGKVWLAGRGGAFHGTSQNRGGPRPQR